MKQTRRAVLRRGAATIAGATAIAGCSGGGPAEAVIVELTDENAFEPDNVTVASGGTVTWVNVGAVAHTVTAEEQSLPEEAAYFASGDFESEAAARQNVSRGLLRTDEEFEHQFEVSGRYDYVCIPHERSEMVGSVRVE